MHSLVRNAGDMVKLPEDENTAQKRADKIFALMDLNKDHEREQQTRLGSQHSPANAQLTLDALALAVTFEEFKEGSKKDPTIVQVSQALRLLVPSALGAMLTALAGCSRRRSRSTTDSFEQLPNALHFSRLASDGYPSFLRLTGAWPHKPRTRGLDGPVFDSVTLTRAFSAGFVVSSLARRCCTWSPACCQS